MNYGPWKLIWRLGVYEEFFNIDNDTFEQTNLLPVANLSAEAMDAYNIMVCAMDAIETDPLPCFPAVVEELEYNVPTLPVSLLVLMGILLTAARHWVNRQTARQH